VTATPGSGRRRRRPCGPRSPCSRSSVGHSSGRRRAARGGDRAGDVPVTSVIRAERGAVHREAPLYYWAVAVRMSFRGPSAAASRPSAGCRGAHPPDCVRMASRSAGRRVGLVAVVVLATSWQFLDSTHWIRLDASSWSSARWRAGRMGARLGHGGIGFVVLLYGSLGLALWTKGLVGPVLVWRVWPLTASRAARAPMDSLASLAGAGILTAACCPRAALYARGRRAVHLGWSTRQRSSIRRRRAPPAICILRERAAGLDPPWAFPCSTSSALTFCAAVAHGLMVPATLIRILSPPNI